MSRLMPYPYIICRHISKPLKESKTVTKEFRINSDHKANVIVALLLIVEYVTMYPIVEYTRRRSSVVQLLLEPQSDFLVNDTQFGIPQFRIPQFRIPPPPLYTVPYYIYTFESQSPCGVLIK